ncbi:MAG: hypothetical protein JWR80_7976 [Bradyrhizobium sp.]|nr:hypothetical protein [Bradyrhizobium sp.]
MPRSVTAGVGLPLGGGVREPRRWPTRRTILRTNDRCQWAYADKRPLDCIVVVFTVGIVLRGGVHAAYLDSRSGSGLRYRVCGARRRGRSAHAATAMTGFIASGLIVPALLGLAIVIIGWWVVLRRAPANRPEEAAIDLMLSPPPNRSSVIVAAPERPAPVAAVAVLVGSKPRYPFDPSRPVTAMTFDIAYIDARDEPSRRRVDIMSVSDYGEWFYIDAWCHLRRDLRSFRSDRVIECISASTGEIVGNVQAHLRSATRRHFEAGPAQKSVMGKAMPGLKALIWIARSDHYLSDNELDILIEFTRERDRLNGKGSAESDWNAALARRWIEDARPTRDEAGGALSRMRAGGSEHGLCRDIAQRLIAADGMLDEKSRKRAKTIGLA